MPLSGKTGALAPLYRNCLFRSSQRTESHDHVSQELVDHVLRWKHGAVDAAMWKGALSQLRMYVLQYGAEVEVTPRPFDDCDGATVAVSALAATTGAWCVRVHQVPANADAVRVAAAWREAAAPRARP